MTEIGALAPPESATEILDAMPAIELGELRIYARFDDRQIRIISNGIPVPEAQRIAHRAAFADIHEAARAARVCVEILASKPSLAADIDGWHDVPADTAIETYLGNLVQAARSALGSTEPTPAEIAAAPVTAPAPARRPWPAWKIALLGSLHGQCWTAKQIAAHPMIATTERAVYNEAARCGLAFSAAPRGEISVTLPQSHLAVFDRAAAAAGQTRIAFLRAWLMRAAADPARFGLVAVGR